MSDAEHWARNAQKAGNLKRPETEIPVPGLAWMFPEGEKPVWVVRGLSASEFWLANAASDRDEKKKQLIMAISSGRNQADAIKSVLSLGDDEMPDEVRRRIAMIELGTVSPDIPKDVLRDNILVIEQNYPEEFFLISKTVLELVGKGAEMGKPKSSTKKPP